MRWPRVFRSPPPSIELSERSVLLVYLFEGLGDLLLLSPIVQALIDGGAQTPIGVLAPGKAKQVFQSIDLPVRVHSLPSLLMSPEATTLEDLEAERIKLSVTLRRRAYHIGVDLTAREGLNAERWLEEAECPVKLGFHTGRSELTYEAPDERRDGLQHWTRYQLAPLAPLGLNSAEANVSLSFPDKVLGQVNQLWGTSSSRVVLIPGARDPEKRMPASVFHTVGAALAGRGAQVVVAGGPGESKLCSSIAKQIGGARTYARKPLGPLLALVSSADIVVTNDTGPMHAAFLSHRRVIALFSTMPKLCWGPMKASPLFATLSIPPNADEGQFAIIEQWVLDRGLEFFEQL